jgi:dTDP-4-amino-4,6-dideoxygalactose transaminase
MMAAKEIMVSVVHLRIDRNDLCGSERDDLPELARFTETHVSLPLHPYLSDEDVDRVIESVRGGW